MFQVIPTIGTILALAVFFLALYFRALQRLTNIAADSVRSVGELPSKSRLNATKVLVNVFDLDTENLPPDKQFELALKTFEKRESDSQRNFRLFLIISGVFLIFAVVYALSTANSAAMIKSSLLLDKGSAVKELQDQGFFSIDDSSVVERLEREASVPRIEDPFERAARFSEIVAKQPVVAELRLRADRNLAPFEVAGDILTVTVPSRDNQPRRFKAYVKRNSPLVGQVIEISAEGRPDHALRLLAIDGIYTSSSTDLQLNFEQFVEIFGTDVNQARTALVAPSLSSRVIDPTCPRYEGFSVAACDLRPVQDAADIR